MTSDLFSLASEAVAQRVVLLLNHVLSGEPEGSKRLLPHAGRYVTVRVRSGAPVLTRLAPLVMCVTPAGLLEWIASPAEGASDLSVSIDAEGPMAGITQLLSGQRPRIEVAGDAAFAADVNWLFENLRWDPRDELARLVGDSPAREMQRVGTHAVAALRRVAQGMSQAAARGFSAGSEPRPRS